MVQHVRVENDVDDAGGLQQMAWRLCRLHGIGGERRFVSIVASRLEAQGAITQGDRAAAKGTQDLR